MKEKTVVVASACVIRHIRCELWSSPIRSTWIGCIQPKISVTTVVSIPSALYYQKMARYMQMGEQTCTNNVPSAEPLKQNMFIRACLRLAF